jgi:hypothetical protein
MAEYTRAKLKHGESTLDSPLAGDLVRLAALVEEVGEAASELTYDRSRTYVTTQTGAGVPVTESPSQRLRRELIQVANVALTWASILE